MWMYASMHQYPHVLRTRLGTHVPHPTTVLTFLAFDLVAHLPAGGACLAGSGLRLGEARDRGGCRRGCACGGVRQW